MRSAALLAPSFSSGTVLFGGATLMKGPAAAASVSSSAALFDADRRRIVSLFLCRF